MFIPFTDIMLDSHRIKLLLQILPFILASLTIGYGINRYMRYRLLLAQRRHDNDFLTAFIYAIKDFPLIISFCLGLYTAADALDLSDNAELFLKQIVFIITTLAFFRVAARATAGLADIRMSQDDNNQANTLIKTVLSFIIYALGIVLILEHFGISVAPLLTAIGVGGMALAFGLQETLANIFAGLQILLSRQIRIGDFIHLSPSEEGCVTDITWRFTTVLTAANNLIIIPNQKMASTVLTNFSQPIQDFTILIPVGVDYASDLEHVEAVTLEVAKTVMQEIDGFIIKEPAVRFYAFNQSSIDFNVILHTANFINQSLLKHRFIKMLTSRYREEKIKIPFPVRRILSEHELQVIRK